MPSFIKKMREINSHPRACRYVCGKREAGCGRRAAGGGLREAGSTLISYLSPLLPGVAQRLGELGGSNYFVGEALCLALFKKFAK